MVNEGWSVLNKYFMSEKELSFFLGADICWLHGSTKNLSTVSEADLFDGLCQSDYAKTETLGKSTDLRKTLGLSFIQNTDPS